MAAEKTSNFGCIKTGLLSPDKFKAKYADHPQDTACFSFNYTKYGSYSNWNEAWPKLSNMPEKKNLFHELMLPGKKVKPYLDIEWFRDEYPDIDPNETLYEIKKKVSSIFQDEMEFSLKKTDIYAASCHRKKETRDKYSFRIVISTHNPQILFKNANAASFLAIRLKQLADGSFPPGIVDGSVYKKTQNLRMIGQCKETEPNHPMIKVNGFDNDLEFIVTNIDNADICIIERPEQESSIPEDLNIVHPDLSQSDRDFVLEEVRKLHPTAYILSVDTNNFIQMNYKDKTEPCFTGNGVTLHDRIGFFCYVQNGFIYLGCHSGNCVDENNKKIIRRCDNKIEVLNAIEKNQAVSSTILFDPGCIPFHFKKDCIAKSLFGMTNLFAEMYLTPRRIKWTPTDKTYGLYYLWDGKLWAPDNKKHIERVVTVQLLNIIDHYVSETDVESEVNAAAVLIRKLQNLECNKLITQNSTCLFYDKDFEDIKDKSPYALSCRNGIVDLLTGDVRQAIPEDNITRCIDIDYTPKADSKPFDDFVRQITASETGPDLDLYNYIRWAIGYAAQGVPDRKIFFVLYGQYGYNGKSLLLNTIRDALSFYAVTMEKAVIVSSPTKTGGSHSSELCQLEDARIGILSETKADDEINDAQIKMLTGLTDKISVRQIYGKQKELKPIVVPFISSNHMIKINLKDDAMYERLALIPFRLSFHENPDPGISYQKPGDPNLSEKFAENREGVLKWIVDCSIFYHKNKNIKTPKVVVDAKNAYRAEMDSLAKFQIECLSMEGEEIITIKEIVASYKQFLQDEGNQKPPRDYRRTLQNLLVKFLTPDKKGYYGVVKDR